MRHTHGLPHGAGGLGQQAPQSRLSRTDSTRRWIGWWAFGESSANGAQSKTFPTLTAFRPQYLGSIDFPNWAGAVYAIELQTF